MRIYIWGLCGSPVRFSVIKWRCYLGLSLKNTRVAKKKKKKNLTHSEGNSWKVKQSYNENLMNKAQNCQRWFTRLREIGAWGECGFVVTESGDTHTHTHTLGTEADSTWKRTSPWWPHQSATFLCKLWEMLMPSIRINENTVTPLEVTVIYKVLSAVFFRHFWQPYSQNFGGVFFVGQEQISLRAWEKESTRAKPDKETCAHHFDKSSTCVSHQLIQD